MPAPDLNEDEEEEAGEDKCNGSCGMLAVAIGRGGGVGHPEDKASQKTTSIWQQQEQEEEEEEEEEEQQQQHKAAELSLPTPSLLIPHA